MVIHTGSRAVIEARRFILGLLLAQHSSDCDDCGVRDGCALRRLASDLGIEIAGQDESVSREVDGRLVRIRERCILCGKCVRVCAEVQGACAIGFRGRGANTTIGPPRDLSLKEAGCVLCRKCVEACPAGAIEFVEKTQERK